MSKLFDWRSVKSAGMTMQERIWLKETAEQVAADFPKPMIVNIGIFQGASMHCLRAGASDAVLVGIDVRPCSIAAEDQLNAEIIIADARNSHSEFGHPIHFLFVDADPRYETVKSILGGWTPKIVENGVFAVLCYSLPAPRWGVKKAVDEWLDTENWKELGAPDTLKAFRKLSD